MLLNKTAVIICYKRIKSMSSLRLHFTGSLYIIQQGCFIHRQRHCGLCESSAKAGIRTAGLRSCAKTLSYNGQRETGWLYSSLRTGVTLRSLIHSPRACVNLCLKGSRRCSPL